MTEKNKPFASLKQKAASFFAPPAKQEKKTPFHRILNLLCALSGGFFLAVYIPYFLWHAFRLHPADTAASLLVFFCVLTPYFFRNPLKKALKRFYTPIKTVWCTGMCFYMVTFLLFCGVILSHRDVLPENLPQDKQTVVVVFGCQVHMDGKPSAELASRVNKAAEVLKKHPDAICITAGGQGENEPMPESVRMKELLVEQGIGEDRIFTEERSTRTTENLSYSLEVLAEQGYKKEDCTFLFVSSAFHTPRILLLADRADVENAYTASSPSPYFFEEALYIIREYMSYVYLFLFE